MSPLSPPTPILNRVKRKKFLFHTHQQESEAATTDVLKVKVFLEILQNSQKNTCARVLNFAKFLRTPLLQKTFGRLLLKINLPRWCFKSDFWGVCRTSADGDDGDLCNKTECCQILYSKFTKKNRLHCRCFPVNFAKFFKQLISRSLLPGFLSFPH